MIDEKSALLYSQLKKFRCLVENTEQFIADSLSKVKKPYVACSFGKDSSAMLHLVLKFEPEIPVICFMWQETVLIDNYDEIIRQWGEINLYKMTFSDVPINRNGKEEIEQNEYIKEKEFDSYFIGIRKKESFGRKVSLRRYGKFCIFAKDELIRIAPLSDWSTDDVATYLISNYVPILNKYKTDGFTARTTTAIPVNYDIPRIEALASLKHRNISAFNRLIGLCPELKSYV